MTTFPRTPLTVPPLENGDRLSRAEFERRYAAMPDTKIVWQVFDRKIDWFYLDNDRYVDLEPGEDGLCRSRVFPGLWLDREAMVRCKALRYWRWCSRGYNPQSTKLLLID